MGMEWAILGLVMIAAGIALIALIVWLTIKAVRNRSSAERPN